jgi:hypothetical protein
VQWPTTSAPPFPTAIDSYRVKSIAIPLTKAELSEIKSAAAKTGKNEKVSEWLRDIALAHVRAPKEERADPVLLAEIMVTRSLMLNLFAKDSQGPLSTEGLQNECLR